MANSRTYWPTVVRCSLHRNGASHCTKCSFLFLTFFCWVRIKEKCRITQVIFYQWPSPKFTQTDTEFCARLSLSLSLPHSWHITLSLNQLIKSSVDFYFSVINTQIFTYSCGWFVPLPPLQCTFLLIRTTLNIFLFNIANKRETRMHV